MKLYDDLASWFHLLTAPEDYEKEAAVYSRLILEGVSGLAAKVLELGSGGGNNASHMKSRFELTLTDISAAMLEVSRGLNPECEHLQGDMRTLRLGRTFDAVFVQDAVMYMTSAQDLQSAMATAVEHCRPGGIVVLAPDCVLETFHEYVHEGGHDGADGRALRYHERAFAPDPGDSTYRVEMTIRLHETDSTERVETEIHTLGLFRKRDWIKWLTSAGLRVEAAPSDLGGHGVPASYIFVGVKPLRASLAARMSTCASLPAW